MDNTINLSDIKKLIATAHTTLCVVIHALNTKVLIGEINRPEEMPVTKVTRKRRTKVEIALNATAGHIKMDLEKEYQTGRTSPILSEANKVIDNLPDADKGHTFYGGKPGEKSKKEREKKEKGEKKVPTVE